MLENFHTRATIAISLGAIAGALCRYYLGDWLTQLVEIEFPIGTLIVNLSGCFLMGLITTLATERLLLKPDLVLMLTTGFLGSYTTFSSYELDSANLLEMRSLQIDLAYWVGTPLLGFLCFSLGSRLAEFIRPSH
ncbi:fluoride efflux transporter CrcB [Myxosarcina sp. GI1(2024)]